MSTAAVPADLGVVVLAYGAGGQHLPLLDSLLAAAVPVASILVVHNPAAPGETIAAERGCQVLETGHNLGYAGGMNRGIAAQRERGAGRLLLLTHDARLRPGALAKLLAAAAAAPSFGVLGPSLVLAGTDVPFSFGGRTRPSGTNTHLTERPAAGPDGIAPCDWVDGGTMLVAAEAIAATGGFDERFWGYCEEADLCLRARRSGFGVGVVVDAAADQEPGGAKRPGPWAYLLTRNGAEYARRAAGLRGAVTIEVRAVSICAENLVRMAVRVVRRRPGGVGEPWAIVVGTARGALDFLRGRWGPPPPGLPGVGDLSNA
jgi:GT2 family glycosyltransferase